ncbi:type I-F CRISPR-associated protein Csy3 [Vibrio cincinnatiensis]|uniref:type I-F CRISPR-associated protein Csy3 n=1 Tax=Vibrio cincinnatiensis TaxID=675 RepID=UPI001EE13AC2|nr:type I-F CRISPR-associated protein Csy3 [Vibrio cincinnatiensis]MCG3726958.1 type I-F CRISPR-associated protein Csy3 [Vibrio cincinnatiensis]
MELCSQMNYVRSLSSGKACFYYLENERLRSLQVDRTHLRAPKAAYSEAFSGDFKAKNLAPQDLAYSNPQFIEECYVPPDVNNIYCSFSLRIRANSLAPEVCADIDVRVILQRLAETYQRLGGYRELANRYAKNLLMGTWLWRNRECRNISIEVKTEQQQWQIDDIRYLEWNGDWEDDAALALNGLSEYLTKALSDKTHYFNIDVRAKLTVGWGDEIYPSQEFLDVKVVGHPSKQLAKVLIDGEESVSFHAQKVGAAIQLIDDWWAEDADKPLRVNEYGADKEYVIARRHVVDKRDFYSLIRRAEEFLEVMNTSGEIPNDVHFVMAVLVKGGVFSGASKKKSKDE